MPDVLEVEVFYVEGDQAFVRVHNKVYTGVLATEGLDHGIQCMDVSNDEVTFYHAFDDEEFTLGEGEMVLRSNTLPVTYALEPPNTGLMVTGTIDINHRPCVDVGGGEIATVLSIGITDGEYEVLIPTVLDFPPRVVDEAEATQYYEDTGYHLGKFDTVPHLETYAERLHDYQELYLVYICG